MLAVLACTALTAMQRTHSCSGATFGRHRRISCSPAVIVPEDPRFKDDDPGFEDDDPGFDVEAAMKVALESQERAAAAAEEAEKAEKAEEWAQLIRRLPSSSSEPRFDLSAGVEGASMDELKAALGSSTDQLARDDRLAAACALVANRDALVSAATSLCPTLEEEDSPYVDNAIRETIRRLAEGTVDMNGSDGYADSPGEAAIIARAAKYLARRVCLPRGVVSPQTAAAMRCVLLGLANEAEAYAWTASGGLL